MRAPVLVVVGLLAGCESLPPPTQEMAPGNAQIRMLELTGELSGAPPISVPIGGTKLGRGCVITILGEPPPGVSAELAGEHCRLLYEDEFLEKNLYPY